MRRGFTLIEVLIAISVVAIVAAISFPVIAKARTSAYKTQSISNMRQVVVAIELYAQDNNGSATGTMESMGLPPWPTEEYLGKSVRGMYPPLRTKSNWDSYMYFPIPSQHDRRTPTWAEYTEKVGSSAVIICDPFFNPATSPGYEYYWQDPFVRKYVMGMTVSGSLVKKTKAGTLDLAWWLD